MSVSAITRLKKFRNNHPHAFLWALSLLFFLSLAGLLVLNVRRFYPFISDDAFISLQYSKRLLSGYGLTWTPGIPVEGYSNLLWVLLVALFGFFGMDLIQVAWLLGFIGMFAALAAILYLFRPTTPAAALAGLTGGALFALAAPIAVWTIGGLEQPLLLALLAWAWVLVLPVLSGQNTGLRSIILPGVLFGLTCLTRPDAPLFVAAAAGAILMSRGFRSFAWRDAALLAGIALLFFVGQTVFRLAYYGEWLPNTALVKGVFSIKHLREGARYLKWGLLALNLVPFLAAAAGLVLLFNRRRRPAALLFGAAAFIWAGYIVFIGGDIFPGWRHLTPLILPMVFLIAAGLEWFYSSVFSRLKKPQHLAVAGFSFVFISALYLGLVYYPRQMEDQVNRAAVEERWEWKGQPVGRLFKQGFGAQQALLAVDPAGSLPYFSDLPAIDMLGLNDHYITHHPPQNLGEGWLGHELGDGAYVLKRRPDIVLFYLTEGKRDPFYLSGMQMVQDPAFAQNYTFTQFLTSPQSGELYQEPITVSAWLNRQSERIGIRQDDKTIIIPA
ncbi:MAG: hypothetical protein LWX83_10060, partial [Anaerolineae bacterium]|nr:hypothetical protein [Anaerolineae bacterium]